MRLLSGASVDIIQYVFDHIMFDSTITKYR